MTVSRLRLFACYGAIAACVPYLTLKLAWLGGSAVGTVGHGTAEMGDLKHVVGNVFTTGMDLVSIVVALAFTYRWGQRLPAWLVLVPIWIGTGLLAPIALGVPLGLVVQWFAGGSPTASDNGLREWVYDIVYGGFTLQAILLLTAFVLYAKTRWAELFRMRTGDLRVGVITPSRRLLVNTAAVAVAGYGVMQLVWAVTGGALGGDPAAVETVAQKTFWVAQGPLTIAAAIGLPALVYRWGHRRVLLPLVAMWVGTGVVFASGLYAATVEVGGSPLRLAVILVGAAAGLLIAVLGLAELNDSV